MYLKKKTIVQTRNKGRPQKTLIILILLCGTISCKSTLIVHEIKTENIPNSGNLTDIDSSVISSGKVSHLEVNGRPLEKTAEYGVVTNDYVAGGHTHTYLQEPLEVKNNRGNRILINQAAWAGLILGRIDFIFDRTGKEQPIALTGNIWSVS